MTTAPTASRKSTTTEYDSTTTDGSDATAATAVAADVFKHF